MNARYFGYIINWGPIDLAQDMRQRVSSTRVTFR